MDTLSIFGEKSPDIIKNPFIKDCIYSIRMSYFKGTYIPNSFEGTVRFKNGNTSGEQNFVGSSLVDVFNQIYKFCNSL